MRIDGLIDECIGDVQAALTAILLASCSNAEDCERRSTPYPATLEAYGSGAGPGTVVYWLSGRDFIDRREGLSNRVSQGPFVRAALRLRQITDSCEQLVDQRRDALIMRMKRAQSDQSPTCFNQVEP
jgi:hypothetical protein